MTSRKRQRAMLFVVWISILYFLIKIVCFVSKWIWKNTFMNFWTSSERWVGAVVHRDIAEIKDTSKRRAKYLFTFSDKVTGYVCFSYMNSKLKDFDLPEQNVGWVERRKDCWKIILEEGKECVKLSSNSKQIKPNFASSEATLLKKMVVPKEPIALW